MPLVSVLEPAGDRLGVEVDLDVGVLLHVDPLAARRVVVLRARRIGDALEQRADAPVADRALEREHAGEGVLYRISTGEPEPAPADTGRGTSDTCMRMQPCEARLPIDQSSPVPWMPTPSVMPIHRAFSGFRSARPASWNPQDSRQPRRVRRRPGRIDLLSEMEKTAGRGRVCGLPDGDAVALDELAPACRASCAAPA